MEYKIKGANKIFNNIRKLVVDTYKLNGKNEDLAMLQTEVDNHILKLLIGIASHHEDICEEEVTFIESLFPEKSVRPVISEFLSFDFNIRKDLLVDSIPQYIIELGKMDKSKAVTVIEWISDLCIEIASIDSNYSEVECVLISMIKAKLKHSIRYIEDFSNESIKQVKNEEKNEEYKETVEEVLKELEELIGLEDVKLEINTLINLTKVNKLREERGLSTVTMSRHMVFTGSPGTGKTTIARLISRIYRALGVLEKGHLVEVDRSGLVVGYIGQTASNVKKVVDSALDGILFIDEAYQLVSSNDQRDFGREAIDALIKSMEDNRKRLVVIVAGYTEPMQKFIDSNPGMKSRFNKYIHFKDYSADELFDIFMSLCRKNGFIVKETAIFNIKTLLEEKSMDKCFGNGRGVRNLFEKLIEIQANRLAGISCPSDLDLQLFNEEDILALCGKY